MIQTYPGILRYPQWASPFNNNFFLGTLTMDTATELSAVYGTVWAPGWNSGSKTIVSIEVYYNSVVVGSGSTFRVSLQDLVAATGDPPRPDLVVDQYWTGAPSGMSAGKNTHALNVGRTVYPGDRLAVVFDYTVFGSGTSITPRCLMLTVEDDADTGVSNSANSGSTWAVLGEYPLVGLVCSDGTRLTFQGVPFFGMDIQIGNDWNPTSTGTGIDNGDERGILWVPRRTYEVWGFASTMRLTSATSEVDLCMYRDTTLLASRTFGVAQNRNLSLFQQHSHVLDAPIIVEPDQNIRFTHKPTGTSSLNTGRWYRTALDGAGDLSRFFGGSDFEDRISITNRVDSGAWNTPALADSSFSPFQIYGRLVPLYGQHVVFR